MGRLPSNTRFMLSLIVLVCITTIKSIGTNANTQFGKVSTKLGS